MAFLLLRPVEARAKSNNEVRTSTPSYHRSILLFARTEQFCRYLIMWCLEAVFGNWSYLVVGFSRMLACYFICLAPYLFSPAQQAVLTAKEMKYKRRESQRERESGCFDGLNLRCEDMEMGGHLNYSVH